MEERGVKMKKRKGGKRRMFWQLVGKVMKKAPQYVIYAAIGSTVTCAIVPWVDMILSLQEARWMFGIFLSWFVFRIFKEDWNMGYSIEETEEMQ